MSITDEAVQGRAVSTDGTEIAYWTSGTGPPLVLVHGTTADHTRWRPLRPFLQPHVTVHAMDRRGRGGSGDAPIYDVTKEFDDVAAVVEAVGQTSGSAVDLLGHSFGGLCAFGAATRSANVRRLVLYEGWPAPNPDALAFPPEFERHMMDMIELGQREAALEAFFKEIVGMPDEELRTFRSLPAWKARIAAVHTIPRESRAIVLDPSQAAAITVPVLLLVGENSPDSIKADPEIVAAALPDAQIVTLEGQQHIAIDLIPAEFAEHVLAFLRD